MNSVFKKSCYILNNSNATTFSYHLPKKKTWVHLMRQSCRYGFKYKSQGETNLTTFFVICFVCGQSTTQQKNYKNDSTKFTFEVISWKPFYENHICCLLMIYRLITAYLLLRVNLDKIMHARWDFDASSARTRRVSALDKHQNWSASALFCLNSRAQSKYAVVNLIHTRRKETFLSFIMW